MLDVVGDRLRAHLFKENLDKLQGSLQLDRAADAHKHREILLLIRNVLKVVEFCLVGKLVGIQRKIQIYLLTDDVQLGKFFPAEVNGFATLRNTRLDLFIGQEFVFNSTVISLDLVVRLNQTSQICTRITVLNPCHVHGEEFLLGVFVRVVSGLFFLAGKVGDKLFDKTFLNESSRRFVRQVEVLLDVVGDRLRAHLFKENLDKLQGSLQLDRAADAHKHREILLLIRNVLKVVEFLQVDKLIRV